MREADKRGSERGDDDEGDDDKVEVEMDKGGC